MLFPRKLKILVKLHAIYTAKCLCLWAAAADKVMWLLFNMHHVAVRAYCWVLAFSHSRDYLIFSVLLIHCSDYTMLLLWYPVRRFSYDPYAVWDWLANEWSTVYKGSVCVFVCVRVSFRSLAVPSALWESINFTAVEIHL